MQNETLPTTAPGPHTLRVYLDNPAITLRANQGGEPQVGFRYDWLAACGTSSAKIGVSEETNAKLQVILLGNPTSGEVEFEVRGVQGQSLQLRLLSADGRLLVQRQVERAGAVEHHRLTTQSTGMLLQRIDSLTESRTIKVLIVR